jgi:hypothetical protein
LARLGNMEFYSVHHKFQNYNVDHYNGEVLKIGFTHDGNKLNRVKGKNTSAMFDWASILWGFFLIFRKWAVVACLILVAFFAVDYVDSKFVYSNQLTLLNPYRLWVDNFQDMTIANSSLILNSGNLRLMQGRLYKRTIVEPKCELDMHGISRCTYNDCQPAHLDWVRYNSRQHFEFSYLYLWPLLLISLFTIDP